MQKALSLSLSALTSNSRAISHHMAVASFTVVFCAVLTVTYFFFSLFLMGLRPPAEDNGIPKIMNKTMEENSSKVCGKQ